ncbi:Uncharacterised protein [Mycobacteroides abscessus subsp. abscessus]|nr:Uncharacterised protein [Mycobacteroides abscessus subsp. abscessus]
MPVRGGDLVDDVGHDLHQRVEFVRGALQILGGEQIDGDRLDAQLGAPLEHLGDALCAHPMPVTDVFEARLASPSSIAVADDRHVLGQSVLVRQLDQPPLVHGEHRPTQTIG